MQGFRSAFVVTGFVVLGLGSSLAWKYPRPKLLWGTAQSPSQVMTKAQALETMGIRCHPNGDWSDLLVDASDHERAYGTCKGDPVPQPDQDGLHWQTPPALLADLGRLPGVTEAQVVIHNDHEAVVMLSMAHGAYAGDRALLQQVEDLVRAACPQVDASNLKILDNRGTDLNYQAASFAGARPSALQIELQAQVDALLGPRQGLVFVAQGRGSDYKQHLQAALFLVAPDGPSAETLQQTLTKSLLDHAVKANKARKRRHAFDDQPILVDQLQIQEWTLRQRPLDSQEKNVLHWGLTSEPPTIGQLALGLTALAPAVFAWCLLLPMLMGKHRLRRED